MMDLFPYLQPGERTEKLGRKVYDILIEHGGARADGISSFLHWWTENEGQEYRFCGRLGFGGKMWADRMRVSCYKEDDFFVEGYVEKTNSRLLNLCASILFTRQAERYRLKAQAIDVLSCIAAELIHVATTLTVISKSDDALLITRGDGERETSVWLGVQHNEFQGHASIVMSVDGDIVNTFQPDADSILPKVLERLMPGSE